MSTTAIAITVIGVRFVGGSLNDIIDNKLVKIEKKRGCKHPKTEKAFCAECGKPMWVTKENRMEMCDFLEMLEEKAPGNIEVRHCSPSLGGIYVGWVLKADKHQPEACDDIPDMELITKQLKTMLEPLGMWRDETKIHIWTHLYLA